MAQEIDEDRQVAACDSSDEDNAAAVRLLLKINIYSIFPVSFSGEIEHDFVYPSIMFDWSFSLLFFLFAEAITALEEFTEEDMAVAVTAESSVYMLEKVKKEIKLHPSKHTFSSARDTISL